MNGDAVTKGQLELDILRVNLAIKQNELSDSQKSWLRKVNPSALATILAVLIAFLGNLWIENNRHDALLTLEKKKTETSLIIEAARPGNPENFKKLTSFYMAVGLIEDEKVIQYLQKWAHDFFTPLVKVKDSGKLVPHAIQGWEIARDGTFYRLHIREGIKTRDGLILDAILLKDILERDKHLIPGYESSEVESQMSLRVKLSSPDYYFVYKLVRIGVVSREPIKK